MHTRGSIAVSGEVWGQKLDRSRIGSSSFAMMSERSIRIFNTSSRISGRIARARIDSKHVIHGLGCSTCNDSGWPKTTSGCKMPANKIKETCKVHCCALTKELQKGHHLETAAASFWVFAVFPFGAWDTRLLLGSPGQPVSSTKKATTGCNDWRREKTKPMRPSCEMVRIIQASKQRIFDGRIIHSILPQPWVLAQFQAGYGYGWGFSRWGWIWLDGSGHQNRAFHKTCWNIVGWPNEAGHLTKLVESPCYPWRLKSVYKASGWVSVDRTFQQVLGSNQ